MLHDLYYFDDFELDDDASICSAPSRSPRSLCALPGSCMPLYNGELPRQLSHRPSYIGDSLMISHNRERFIVRASMFPSPAAEPKRSVLQHTRVHGSSASSRECRSSFALSDIFEDDEVEVEVLPPHPQQLRRRKSWLSHRISRFVKLLRSPEQQ
ncbi:hypothetical protein BDW22DRAFT_1427062 [Trametopsis cervina]|nr:hypothetical protein BDW22DRAFT_1427062 [Trametopsis cervina]